MGEDVLSSFVVLLGTRSRDMQILLASTACRLPWCSPYRSGRLQLEAERLGKRLVQVAAKMAAPGLGIDDCGVRNPLCYGSFLADAVLSDKVGDEVRRNGVAVVGGTDLDQAMALGRVGYGAEWAESGEEVLWAWSLPWLVEWKLWYKLWFDGNMKEIFVKAVGEEGEAMPSSSPSNED